MNFINPKLSSKLKVFVTLIGIVLLIHACANRGSGPTGGPKDTTPPRVMKSFPANGALNFKKKQIQIDFDEMISIEKPTENVIISPPQLKPPDVKAYGKNVIVNFNEDLKDSTTYSINFGNGIVDLNEKNAVKNYLFSFSTGNQIDTLKISGTVVDAENQNPLSGIIVGIYREMSDSVFFETPFLRIGRTDEKGHFSIDNIKKGKYKIFALGDTNHDYYYQPGEGLAFCDSLIAPTFHREEMQDTVWKDSVTVDSIHKFMGTRFLPDNLTLRYFKENKKRQYFVKYERKEPFAFSLFFSAPAAQLPELKPLNFEWKNKYMLQKNERKDSLTYWLTDSTLWQTDTLRMAMRYYKTDSVYNLKATTDTLDIIMRKAKVNPKQTVRAKPKAEPLRFSNNIKSPFDVYSSIVLKFEAPLTRIDQSKIKLSEKVDTIFKQRPFKWRQIDSTKIAFAIDYKWLPEKTYVLKIDSAAFVSIYGKTSNKSKNEFKIHSLDDYSEIEMILTPFNPKAVLQVLDAKDNVIASKLVAEKATSFPYLQPSEYYIRFFIDDNGNGVWDPGDLKTRKQPEQVYYYPKKLVLKANWKFEETWDYKQLLPNKPAELIKESAKNSKNNKND